MKFLLTTQEHILMSTAANAVEISAIMPGIVFQYLYGQQETVRNIDIRKENEFHHPTKLLDFIPAATE